jgi:hypothetical protein
VGIRINPHLARFPDDFDDGYAGENQALASFARQPIDRVADRYPRSIRLDIRGPFAGADVINPALLRLHGLKTLPGCGRISPIFQREAAWLVSQTHK